MKGIRLKLLVYTSLLLMILLFVNYLLQGNLITRFYNANERDRLVNYAQKIASYYKEDIDKMKETALGVANTVGGRVSIFDEKGNIIFQSGNFMFGRTAKIESQYLGKIIGGELVYAQDEIMLRQSQLLTLGYPIKNENVKGAIFIHIPSFTVKNDVARLKGQFTVLLIIAIIISILGAIILSSSFTNPILNIKNAAEKISKGDYETRVNITSSDEIGELAKTINDMAVSLSRTEKLRRDFIANVTHEFRTPLGIIKGYAEALYDDLVPEEQKKEYIGAIIEEVERLNKLVNENLTLSKIESGNITLKMETVNLLELLQEAIDKVKILKGNREIKLAGDYAEIALDAEYFKMAILNIISNSIKHTGDDGKIEVRLIKDDNIKISIKDDGEGIDNEYLPYIFERFYRAKEKGVGGLGLSIAREIIRLHGGEILVKSEVGKGTEFLVLLDII
ncbi:Signal transduction histidine-protein kinase ArlS [Caloramator mitchellensis]|uniref:histidine kinase n=1 Tax=Caloramator mitchellensis TaxID=908809 RepID=A0A0R3JTJ4_CALMK|nr:HAMP domain-containing sensor histidine kinase [Caloramator mitchellensis]KRQ86330.1 Signal transduction histidine-protein kinase ArlS [Caloramator mitchellensis]